MKKTTLLIVTASVMLTGCLWSKHATITKYQDHWTAIGQAKYESDAITRVTKSAQATCANLRSRGYATFFQELEPEFRTVDGRSFYEVKAKFTCESK